MEQAVVVSADDRLVDNTLDQDRDRDRERREGERAGEPERDQAPLLPPEREEPAQRWPEGEIGRIDVRFTGPDASSRVQSDIGGDVVTT